MRHAVVDVGEQGRLDEPAARRSAFGPAAADDAARAFRLALVDVAEHAIALAIGDERADLRRHLGRIADVEAADRRRERVDALLRSARAAASTRVCATQAWPLFIVPAPTICGITAARSASSSTIAADLPPSSSVTRRSRSPHERRDLAARGGAAGEADLVDVRMRDQVLADLAARGQQR